ncbi:hypothetical protein BUE80_DR011721 [Diplocarpon rosae]|nr:hypothetical protein BUE80_DR011721 [Diplocarpon rosae]
MDSPTTSDSRSSSSSSVQATPPSMDNNKFTFFGKLPPEMRSKIWRMAFPAPDHFCLGHAPFKNTGEAKAIWDIENKAALPITLRVCQGSREETLRNYSLLYPSEINGCSSARQFTRPICADASKDVGWIEFATLMAGHEQLHDWLSGVTESNSTFMQALTTLEVREFFFFDYFKRMFVNNYQKTRNCRGRYCASFLQFPGLKKITFTGSNMGRDWESDEGRALMRWFGNWIGAFLEENKASFSGGKIPALIFRPYRTIQDAVADSDSTGLRL